MQATAAVGRRRNSQVLIANAWHHRTDAVSSVVALVAIVGSMCGAPMLDPIAGLMVAGMVSLTGVQVRRRGRDAIASPPPPVSASLVLSLYSRYSSVHFFVFFCFFLSCKVRDHVLYGRYRKKLE